MRIVRELTAASNRAMMQSHGDMRPLAAPPDAHSTTCFRSEDQSLACRGTAEQARSRPHESKLRLETRLATQSVGKPGKVVASRVGVLRRKLCVAIYQQEQATVIASFVNLSPRQFALHSFQTQG